MIPKLYTSDFSEYSPVNMYSGAMYPLQTRENIIFIFHCSHHIKLHKELQQHGEFENS